MQERASPRSKGVRGHATRFSALATALGFLVAPAGCGDAASDAASSSEINGGRVEPGYASAGVVDTNLGAFCSGVLIAENVVLTAAHCAMSHFGVETPSAFYLGRGAKLPAGVTEVPDDARLTRHDVAEAVVFGEVDDILTDACPHETPDVAMLRLAAPVTDVTPAVLSDAEPEAGEDCTSVGYGHHEDAYGTNTMLLRRSARLTMVETLPQALHLARKTGISEGGDSGGPLFCRRKLVGLTSCGDTATYETDDYYARLSTVRAKIERKLKAWRPPG